MTTNWQDPHAAAPQPPKPSNNNPKKRFAIVGVLLVVIAGLAAAAGLVMANRGDDGGQVADDAQYVIMETATSTAPVFEPAFTAGDDPFYPLETQLVAYRAEAEEEIAEQVAIAQAEAEPGEDIEVPVFDVAELEENVKTGLYGGTEENTCDPERLISFLIANPEIGEAWAQVQGIEFAEIPTYIRGLEVRVLAADLAVQNHGYDVTTQSAYAIDAVLAAGTAVLVDENGDVRTRCYCGNPIVPKPPVNYMPPRCIIWGASVFTVPGGTTRRDNAPTDVLLTGREALRPDGSVWVEVKWGTSEEESGWVRHDYVRNHFCPPPTNDYECPGPDEVPVYANDKTTVVGYVTGTLNLNDGPTEIFAPIEPVSTAPGDVTIEDGFLLIHFTRVGPSNSGWVNTDDLNQDEENCHHIPQCVEITQNVRSRPGGADLGPGYAGKMWVTYTGKFAPENSAYTEVRLLDFGSQVGWVAPLFVTNLAPEECDDKEINNCVQEAQVYENSNTLDAIGVLNNAEVIILSAVPQDGRININMAPGGPEGWVNEGNFMGGWNACQPVPECYGTGVPAHAIYETDGAILAPDPTPRLTISLVGKRVFADGATPEYLRIEEAGVRYWIPTGELITYLPENCEIDAECPTPLIEGITGEALTPLGSGALRYSKVQNPDPGLERQPDPEGGETPANECCVTALFNSPNDADPSVTSVPRVVTVVGSDNVDPDLAWFTTSDGDYFQRSHLAPAGSDACTPACPEYDGDDDGRPELEWEDLLDDFRDELGDGLDADFTSIAVIVDPDQPMKQGNPGKTPGETPVDGCCVTELHVAPGTGNTIVVPELVNVEAGPESGPGGDWFRTDTGQYFPEGAVTNPADCDREIDCPSENDRYKELLGEIDVRDELSVGKASAEPYVQSLYFQGVNLCCVEAGSVLYGGPGEAPGVAPTTEPRLVNLEDVSVDGMYAMVTFLDDFSTAWVSVDALVPSADCYDDDYECPRGSVEYDDKKNKYCCVEDGDGGFEFIDESEILIDTVFADSDRCLPDDNTCEDPTLDASTPTRGPVEVCCVQIDGEYVFVGVDTIDDDTNQFPAEYCIPVTGCPGLNTGVTSVAPETLDCCVTVNGETLEVTLTGQRQEVPTPGSGVWEYEATNGVWYLETDFDPDLICYQRSEPVNPPAPPAPRPEPTTAPVPTPTTPPVPQDPCENQGGDRNGNGICDNDEGPDCTLYGGDQDQDGVCDDNDPCIGADRDTDGVQDDCDNCPGVSNPQQLDSDGDGAGNECDEPEDPCADLGGDIDNDGICDQQDECTSPDADGDGSQDDCDVCPGVYSPGNVPPFQNGTSCEEAPPCPDRDGDTFCDSDDLCPDTPTSVNEYPNPNNPVAGPCVFVGGGNNSNSGGSAGTGALAPGALVQPGIVIPPLVLDLDLDDEDPLI